MDAEALVIDNSSSSANWDELWRYRGLLFFLAWRDIVLRYKQTVIGVAWALFPPLASAGIFSLVFGKLARLPSGGIPYPMFVLAATVPWSLFAGSISQGSNSVVGNAHLITKVYFPRLIIPLGAVLTSVVDFVLSAAVLAVVMTFYRFNPGWHALFVVPFFLLALTAAVGLGLWAAALQVRYRDIRHVVPILLQVGLYASPVGFSSSMIPPHWRSLYALNPMVGVIDGFRWSLLRGVPGLCAQELLLSSVVSLILIISGILYFRKTESTFADVI